MGSHLSTTIQGIDLRAAATLGDSLKARRVCYSGKSKEVRNAISKRKIKDVMVPTPEYDTVSPYASLYNAIMVFGGVTLADYDHLCHEHRAILGLENYCQQAGKLSQLDLLHGLKPGYRSGDPMLEIKHWVLSIQTMLAMITLYLGMCRLQAQSHKAP